MSPDREITLEEWIAAGQACCGGPADDDEPADDPPAQVTPSQPAHAGRSPMTDPT